MRVRRWLRNRWQRLDNLLVTAVTLVVIAAIMLVIGARLNQSTLNVVGGAVLGSGLAVFVGTWTGREAVRQQNIKEANIRRKMDTYGPMHAEIKGLRETLHEARTATVPYPRYIVIDKVEISPYTGLPMNNGPVLNTWPTFKGNYYADDFSLHAQALFNELQECAHEYNRAITAVREAAKAYLKPCVAASVKDVLQSPEYQQKAQMLLQQQNQIGGYSYSQDRSWLAWLVDQMNSPSMGSVELAEVWSRAWVEQWPMTESQTVGWLLTEHSERAIQTVLDGFRDVLNTYDPPPQIWVEEIVRKAEKELIADPVFQRARDAFDRLNAKVREAEHLLQEGLLIIRDRYEGGAPLV